MVDGASVKRFVFKELKQGDLKKFVAASATSGNGGGARDQRFSPYREFDVVFAAMFPEHEPVTRKMRDGSVRESTLYSAPVAVHIADTGIESTDKRVVQHGTEKLVVQTLKYWPPTARRPNEGRLGQVSKLQLNPPTKEGRVFLLLFDDSTPISPRLAFVTESAVQTFKWEKSINDFFSGVLATPERDGTVMGYGDLVNNTSYIKPVR